MAGLELDRGWLPWALALCPGQPVFCAWGTESRSEKLLAKPAPHLPLPCCTLQTQAPQKDTAQKFWVFF